MDEKIEEKVLDNTQKEVQNKETEVKKENVTKETNSDDILTENLKLKEALRLQNKKLREQLLDNYVNGSSEMKPTNTTSFDDEFEYDDSESPESNAIRYLLHKRKNR